MIYNEYYELNRSTPILLTGGAGFVGSHVADNLLKRGEDVIIVDDMNDYYNVKLKEYNIEYLMSKYNKQIKFIKGDISDMVFMENIFSNYRPRRIVHLAARAGVRPSIENPFIYIRSNIIGTTNLFELARKYGNDCIVWASSSSVYGNNPTEEYLETDNVDRPMSQYAATKKSCELIAHTYHSLYKLNITGLRFFTVYGPRGRIDMAPAKFIDNISKGIEIQQFGDGTTERDYTYIDDIVDGVIRALDMPMGYQIFNLGNGNPCKLSDFISLIEKYTKKYAKIKKMPLQLGDVHRTCANISKARQLLGYNPITSLEEGIKRTVEWYLSTSC